MGAQLARQWQRRRLASARVMRIAGIWLGIVITAGLAVLVGIDRQARLAAAERQSLALASGVDRLLHVQLRNIERALRGVLADSDADAQLPPEAAARRREVSIAGVVDRHEEIARIDFHPAPGADPGLSSPPPSWLARVDGPAGRLVVGPLEADDAGWHLPMAVQGRDGAAVVAMFRAAGFADMISGLDVGREGSVAILEPDGTVIIRLGPSGAHAGRQIALPAELASNGQHTLTIVSVLDQVQRLASFSATSGYPLVVGTGLGLREALRPWWINVACAGLLALLYWVVLTLVVLRLRAEERRRDAMLDEIATQSDWLQQAQLASGTGVWRVDVDAGDARVSDELASLYGLELEPGDDSVPLETLFACIHPEDSPAVRSAFDAMRAGEGPLLAEYRVALPDGRMRWLKVRGDAVPDAGRGALTGTVIDITDRRATQLRVERAETQFRQLFERNPLPSWVYDTESLRMLAVNDAALDAYGYSREAFLGLTITELIPPASPPPDEPLPTAETPQRRERLWTVSTRDGGRVDVRVHARDIELRGRPARLMLAEDVGARLAYERDLAWRATHDATTGMMTLPALAERLDARCATEEGAGFGVACVRLRDIELIAPTLGRDTGERLLQEAAARFADVARRFGLAAYAPAETFVVVTLEPERLQDLVRALGEAVEAPVQLGGGTFPLEAWLGLACGPCEDGGAEQVIAHAALAALRARAEKVPLVVYDRQMSTQAAERLALVQRLRDALERGEFELAYQPIHRLSDLGVVSVEALIRWRRPDGRCVSPLDFIPLAEESGLIVPIGAWVLEEAARAYRRLADAGRGDVSIAVNVSAVQFESGISRDGLRALRAGAGLPVRALHLELTESVLLRNPDAARVLMLQLHEDGVCLSIDDFGTGFSSMAYLRDLPLDHLKIDRGFVRDVASDPRSAAICRTLIGLGHGLGLSVVAEGVEDAAQLDWLRAEGCDLVQGYHLGRPMPLDALLARLAGLESSAAR
ncbi:bifunctional diguanylate cyclase/phosphodiesterase [Luteimonas deserti]|uniref:EAL domain-containing protein n=1 Tax=Luteimonas deserti TaxID=2752306 RepID=A0A7Z0TY67_9GAMM|nr:EAL domain-containing protein [Luteimonas deserti]NYZ62600.1 EAL domain-containing protein [Luteimonas deserti]